MSEVRSMDEPRNDAEVGAEVRRHDRAYVFHKGLAKNRAQVLSLMAMANIYLVRQRLVT